MELDRSSRYLYNNHLTDILDSLNTLVGVIDLHSNRLGKMPSLNEYKPLDTVKEVILGDNNIERFYWHQFPLQTEVIDLSYNELKILPIISDYDTCLLVKTLTLYKNRIQEVKAEQLPTTIEYIDLRRNYLSLLPDLSHLRLSKLSVPSNSLSEVGVALHGGLCRHD